MTVQAIPDTEWALREWLRAQLPDVKVYFDPPKGPNVVFPMITIPGRIGGAPDPYTGVDEPRVSFQCWGGTGGGGRDRARQTMSRLAELINSSDGSPFDTATWNYGGTVDSIVWLPDDSDSDNVLARYVLDASFTVRAI